MNGLLLLLKVFHRRTIVPAFELFKSLGIYMVLAVLITASVVQIRWYIVDSKSYFIRNQPAAREFRAIRDSSYEDIETTEAIRKKVSESIKGVIVEGHMESRIGFHEECDILINSPLEDTILSTDLRELLDTIDLGKREEIIATVREINDALNAEPPMTAEKKAEFIWQKIPSAETDPASANMIYQIITGLREGDIRIDGDLTERTRTLVADDIKTIRRILYMGDIILNKGEMITPQYAAILHEQGYIEGRFPYPMLGFALIVACISVSWIYSTVTKSFQNAAFHVGWSYAFVMLVMGWMFQIAVIAFGISGLAVFPIIAIIYLTFPANSAVNCALTVTLSSAVIACGYDVHTFTINAVAGCAGVMAGKLMFKKNFSRTAVWLHIFELGLLMDLVSVLVQFGISSVIDNRSVSIMVATTAMLGFMVVALLPLIEIIFDVISPLQLVELTQPSHPLQKRLLLEAPGTYHHSQMVGNLAEAGAEALGLNPMLLRAGACYHDIGKLKRPQLFIENQMGDNSHDEMDPLMSAKYILAHVTDGLSIARDYHLPSQVQTFIREHHGTTCLTYFFKKAIQEGMRVEEGQFRYNGPIPQSIESCVLMLADSTEAAARAMTGTRMRDDQLSKIVDSVMQSKLSAGQLDSSTFTLKDLTAVKVAFVRTLRSMYHTRDIKPLKNTPPAK